MKASLWFSMFAAISCCAANPLYHSDVRGASSRSAVRLSSANRFTAAAPDDSTTEYYLATFVPPSGQITNFVSTMTIPGLSKNTKLGPRYVWPGMQNAANNFVFQDVIGDQQPAGRWTFATWYVGDGQEKEYTRHTVVPGDTATSTFHLANNASVTWTEKFSISGTDKASGGNNPPSFSSEGALVSVLFAIELQGGSKWDFGSVTWSNISITASTTDTAWCTSPDFQTVPDIGNFSYSITTPKATVQGASTTCTVSKIVFKAP